MVKIRYSDLPAGLHVATEADGRGAVVYLLPGLTPAQRRAALSRARTSARMGQGPRLPGLGMAAAIAADRVRTTARTGTAAMRGHPILFLPPLIALATGAIVLTLMSVVPPTGGEHGNVAPATAPRLGIDPAPSISAGQQHSGRSALHHAATRLPGRTRTSRTRPSPGTSASGFRSAVWASYPADPTRWAAPDPAPGAPVPSR
jgi:hypothetical protein